MFHAGCKRKTALWLPVSLFLCVAAVKNLRSTIGFYCGGGLIPLGILAYLAGHYVVLFLNDCYYVLVEKRLPPHIAWLLRLVGVST